LIVAWSVDFLFWKKPAGVSFLVFVALGLVAFFILARGENLQPARKSVYLLVPIGLFAILAFLRQEPLTRFLSHFLALSLTALLAHTFLGGRWLEYNLGDYVVGIFQLIVSSLGRPISLFEARRKGAVESSEEGEEGREVPDRPTAWRRALPVLRGLLLALPIVAIFASLLASADPVFADYLQDFADIFKLENLPEYIFRLIYILILAYLFSGVYLHALARSHDEVLVGEEKSWLPPFLGFTEATIVLGSVVALFATFVGVQFRYFFGGQNNIHIEGFTYAEYARRGFGELDVVALFSLLLFLGLSAITRRERESHRRAFSGLGIALVLMVVVILVSAYQRLLLYEAAYGFTRLRTYTHVFMVWLGLLLLGVVLLELLQRQRAFVLAALVTTIGFSLTLNLLNVDGFIARQNVNRARNGTQLDVNYLSTLSSDAVPALVDVYQSTGLADVQHDEIGGILACQEKIIQEEASDNGWGSFRLPDYRALRLLAVYSSDLREYEVRKGEYGTWWVTVNGEKRTCVNDWWD
jgi:uncharacterized membrane protein